jgi:imidazole glycerol-phosphate synthase subunit HisF
MEKKFNLRLIARLDIKGENLIKGVHLEGLRVIGCPSEHAIRYYQQGADELIFIDSVASLYGRNNLIEIVKKTTKDVFIPITVGGGIRSVDDVTSILRSGADKIAVNTAVVRNPNLISEIANIYGNQCVILSLEAKQTGPKKWEVFVDNGRERTGLDAISWVKEAVRRGVGEILVTSVDREGTRKGFDIDLLKAVVNTVSVPVVASGGMGKLEHALNAANAGCDALAIASILHYQEVTIQDVRKFFDKKKGFNLRQHVQ